METPQEITIKILKQHGLMGGYTWAFTLPNGATCRDDIPCLYASDAERYARGALKSLRGNYSSVFEYPNGI